MIILQMIDNYKNQDELYEEKNDIELESIFEQNLKIRENNKLIQEYHLDEKDVKLNNIENIYSKIIISLIINDKIVDFEKTSDILTQLGLKTINITKKIFYDLFDIFNSDKEYITKYMISKVDDFSDEKKINFYYILLTFIFKNDIYIYNIPLLLNARKAILTILKNNFGKLLEINNNNNNKEKNEFVIKKLCDESYYYYYYCKYLNSKDEEFKEVLKYYKTFLFESKKNDIIILENMFKNSKPEIDYFNYLIDYKTSKIVNERESIIMLFFNEKNNSRKHNNNNNDKRKEEEIQKCIKEWEEIEKDINNNIYIKLTNDKNKLLLKYFSNDDNKEVLLKIFEEKTYNSLMNKIKEKNRNNAKKNEENEKNHFYNNNKELEKENENKSTKSEKSSVIIKGVIDETESQIIKKIEKNNEEVNQNIQSIVYDSEMKKEEIYDPSYYEIMHYVDTIGKHNVSAESIQEISQGYFISFGLDNILSLYNQEYNKVLNIKTKDNISSISERETKEKTENNNIKLIVSDKKQIRQMKINTIKNHARMDQKAYISLSASLCLEVKENNHLVCGNEGIYEITDLCSVIINNKCDKICNKSYIGGIVINDEISAFTSNEVLGKGEDCLVFYNIKRRKFVKTINGYSFIKSTKGLTLFQNSDENSKILLCACKKYKKNQKNGILLVNINTGKPLNIVHSFYHTKNFEVFCFCQIGIKSNNNPIRILDELKYNNNNNLSYTDYFFVGGYDKGKSRGSIKLFKLIKSENNYSIEYIQDIDIEKSKKFEGFKDTINCIIQSKRKGDILVTSWDGGVYLLSPPKMDLLTRENDLQYNFQEEEKIIIIGVE